jgi:rhodanese-related sulfurtransferase
MKKAYVFMSILMIVVAVSILLLPERSLEKEIPPADLLVEINDASRYMTTDQVAAMIISGDPSLLLIDNRDKGQYEDYHLPGALNMSLPVLTDPSNSEILDQEGKQIVFYSNGDILAEQAWVISKRMGLNNIFVMKDGLNRWMETIITPEMPAETAASEAFDLYQFRIGASIYFGGGNLPATQETTVAEPVVFQKKEKRAAAEGGC